MVALMASAGEGCAVGGWRGVPPGRVAPRGRAALRFLHLNKQRNSGRLGIWGGCALLGCNGCRMGCKIPAKVQFCTSGCNTAALLGADARPRTRFCIVQ